jgi:hypothetical protein
MARADDRSFLKIRGTKFLIVRQNDATYEEQLL